MKEKVVVIVGAGPAGLTAAHELLVRGCAHPVIVEADTVVGGLSRTVNIGGNRMDVGGHRFFSKNKDIVRWWLDMMPMQTVPAADGQGPCVNKTSAVDAVNPELSDKVMLYRKRFSRIFFLRRFFDYPIRVSFSTFRNLGILRTINVVSGYIWARISRRKENSLEDFYINRFGKSLYCLFFEKYTEKVWGKHPSDLDAGWGSQRVKGLSLFSLLANAFKRKGANNDSVETSLIENFYYPKYGPGQLWECVADSIEKKGGKVLLGHRVENVLVSGNKVVEVRCVNMSGEVLALPCDCLMSSMPLSELLPQINGMTVPKDVCDIAVSLPYRDFITVGVLLRGNTDRVISGVTSRLSDTWIYIQEPDVRAGRLQVFNNWSPYMVVDSSNTLYVGMEYFCNEGDDLWGMADSELSKLAVDELVKMGFATNGDILATNVIRMKKAYPAYHGSYCSIDAVRSFLDGISNLYCIGRNGQHRYNNMDHSMLTAIKAVDAMQGLCEKSLIWNVNTEHTYNEEVD